jgi:hypothetical protein
MAHLTEEARTVCRLLGIQSACQFGDALYLPTEEYEYFRERCLGWGWPDPREPDSAVTAVHNNKMPVFHILEDKEVV